jgi:two-component system sensor histidine kinase KdpD
MRAFLRLSVIDNACKYSPAESPVTVFVQFLAKQLVVSVEDCGTGIPLEDRDRIFEKFYRGKNGITGRSRGTGLGLAISRGIVEAHGGSIHIEEGRGSGTRVVVKVPLADHAA